MFYKYYPGDFRGIEIRDSTSYNTGKTDREINLFLIKESLLAG
jgi:hypothetical protein